VNWVQNVQTHVLRIEVPIAAAGEVYSSAAGTRATGNRPEMNGFRFLTFGVLRTFTRLMPAIFFALYRAWIAGDESGLL
jgi:hypothetical protein